jgi:homoserine dehydrogenase
MISQANNSISVLKFGSSVLRSEADLPSVVHEIYGELRRGHRVLVVPSAFGSTTDELLALAKAQVPEPEPRVLARLLATGESTSAALLSLALKRAGIKSRLIGPETIGLETEGGYLDAHPVDLDIEAVKAEFEAAPVLVLPGFISRRKDGELALLGRGGSDLTAIFVASRIRAARCVLVKDVEGLFEWDPAGSATHPPRRFARISYGDALGLSGAVVQHKAIRLAREADIPFEVCSASALGLQTSAGTIVGSNASAWDTSELQRFTRLRVGLIGHGTVGAGVLDHLFDAPEDFEVAGVLVRDLQKHRERFAGTHSPAERNFEELFTTDASDLMHRDLDIVVEVAGGVQPVGDWLQHALERGISVVTANKALIAECGLDLQATAKKFGAALLYSAAVGCSAPLLETAQRLRTSPVRGLQALLNGTTNFILECMQNGASPEDAIFESQERGFAEADPTLDLDGTDAIQKVELLARALYGEDVQLRWGLRQGLERPDLQDLLRDARESDGSVRIVASCYLEEGDKLATNLSRKVFAEVYPVVLPGGCELAKVTGAGAGAVFELDTPENETVFVSGVGAGRWPTSESVMADLLDLRRFPELIRGALLRSSSVGNTGG